MKDSIKNAKGQISLFLALVFIVLFTLFGMTISLGMFVHDKINLQNASDLASYYVATKQAELLEAMAHSNYQIRQSWKLLAFRYRVLSNGSRTAVGYRHPGTFKYIDSYISNHDEYGPAAIATSTSGQPIPPRVCAAATHLFQDLEVDNYCNTLSLNLTFIPKVPKITLGGLVNTTNDTIEATNLTIQDKCSSASYLDWWFANSMVGAHKLEQRDRKDIILKLAENLAQPVVRDGMKDLEGKDVFEGARKTFMYNLNESLRIRTEEGSEDEYSFQVRTFMEGKKPEEWLREINTNLIVPYSGFHMNGVCREELMTHLNDEFVYHGFPPVEILKTELDPDDIIRDMGAISPFSDSLYNISIGFEKNPWFMIYNQIKVVHKSAPLFNVLGKFIPIKATSYSKPFGGRIGPWFESQWASGAKESSGGKRTDALLPKRVPVSELGNITEVDPDADPTIFPNFSRFPGDTQGLSTYASMVAYGKVVGDWGISVSTGSIGDVDTSYKDYRRATYSYFNGDYNDPLAQDVSEDPPEDSFNRRMEIAAIAPDAFDMTYYTILPRYYDTHIKDKLDQWLPARLSNNVQLRGDIGGHEQNLAYSIVDQFQNYEISNEKDHAQRTRRSAWLQVSGFGSDAEMWMGILNSWMPGKDVMQYRSISDESSISSRFMRCLNPVRDDRVLIPSMCNNGGRVGYSVKMISGNYLRSQDHPIGGGGNRGPILNPPPAP